MAPSRVSPDTESAGDHPGLSPKQVSQFHRDGYLIIPGYLTRAHCDSLLSEINSLLSSFDLSSHPMTKFSTGEKSEHVGDSYFLDSGDKVRFFFEEDAFGADGALAKPKERAINKIGHALHTRLPRFADVSHRGAIGRRNAAIARALGYRDPRLLQSMVICKQPEIGGAVPPHQDSTFLYTDRPSAVGFWIALEDATVTNGCLSFAPGSHRRAAVRSRFVRKADGSGTTFEEIADEEKRWPSGFEHEDAPKEEQDGGNEEEEEEEYVLGEVEAGSLVLIHGNILHKSEKNLSDKGRIIYTFHLIEGEEHYDERNWLQVLGGPAEFTKLDGSG